MPVLNLLKGRIRQHISKLMNSYILHDEPVLPVPSISRRAQLKDRATTFFHKVLNNYRYNIDFFFKEYTIGHVKSIKEFPAFGNFSNRRLCS